MKAQGGELAEIDALDDARFERAFETHGFGPDQRRGDFSRRDAGRRRPADDADSVDLDLGPAVGDVRDLPFDELKVDRGFVHGAWRDSSLRAILSASLAMARDLGLRTVAEGVEEREDWDLLRALGCDLAQGYFVARPMPGAALTDWIGGRLARRRRLEGAHG